MTEDDIEVMQKIFNPGSVAVIGATASSDRIGYNLLDSLIYGGYKGKIYPVHPKLKEILGLPVYPSILDIPERVDLALIALNQRDTVDVLEHCGKLASRAPSLLPAVSEKPGTRGGPWKKGWLK